MPIVGGLDIHRKQLTFDYLDTVTGEVRRGHRWTANRSARRCSRVVRSAIQRQASAAHDLAAKVLTGGFRVLRLSRVLGWADLMVAIGFAGAGVFLLSTSATQTGWCWALSCRWRSARSRGCDACATGPEADSAQRGEGSATHSGRKVGRPGEARTRRGVNTKERDASWSAQVMPLATYRLRSDVRSVESSRGRP